MAKKTTKKEEKELKKVEVEETKDNDLEAPVEETKEEKEQVEVISLDNTPVDPIVIENDDETIPNNFVPAKKVAKNNKKLLVHNGRVYKVLNNGRGMYADNGETFSLNEIK